MNIWSAITRIRNILWCEAAEERPARLILAAVFVAGLGQILMTPPFEGFDETAHYSSIQLIADERRIPVYNKDRYSADVTAYLKGAPGPYASVPPFDDNGGLTYQALEDLGARERARRIAGAPPQTPRAYRPDGALNWQAQHPPLAYIALVPVYEISKGLDWKRHLFALRLACWCVAFAGLVIGWRACMVHFSDQTVAGERAIFAAMLAGWPVFAPMFTVEMARLGNDAFCLFFAGLGFRLLLDFLRDEPGLSVGGKLKAGAAVGLVFGLGALTKAFFLPAFAGVLLFLALRAGGSALKARDWRLGNWRLASSPVRARRSATIGSMSVSSMSVSSMAVGPIAAAVVFAALAGGWYLAKLINTGALTGSNDMAQLAGQGPLAALCAAHFSVAYFIQRVVSIYFSFVWTGTWSFAKPAYWTIGLLAAGLALPVAGYLWRLVAARGFVAAQAAPVFIVGPVFAGLCYHAFVQVCLGPQGIGTPGYYLHIFAGPLSLMLALGLLQLDQLKTGSVAFGRMVAAGLVAYGMVFFAIVQFYQLNLFTGCAVKLGDNRFYQETACFGALGENLARLGVLAFPNAAMITWSLSGIALIASFFVLLRQLSGKSVHK